MEEVSEEKVNEIGRQMLDKNVKIWERYRALFTLENIKGINCANWIMKLIDDESELLAHEAAYCLGQMQESSAIDRLVKTLETPTYPPIVRHEAAEALGAIEDESAISLLQKYSSSDIKEIAETCQLALQRIKYFKSENEIENESNLATIDPAPPLETKDLKELKLIYLNSKEDLFKRYRAMFTLRNIDTNDAVEIIAKGLECGSPLLKHEVAFVLGQIQNDLAEKYLMKALADTSEHPMVRHECAIALGSILSESSRTCLEKFSNDPTPLVSESCLVALDMLNYQFSGEFQYANKL